MPGKALFTHAGFNNGKEGFCSGTFFCSQKMTTVPVYDKLCPIKFVVGQKGAQVGGFLFNDQVERMK